MIRITHRRSFTGDIKREGVKDDDPEEIHDGLPRGVLRQRSGAAHDDYLLLRAGS